MSETKHTGLNEALERFDRQAKLNRLTQELCQLLIEEAAFHDPDEKFSVSPDSPIAMKTREVEAALGGEQKPDLEAHERDLERRANCGVE